MKEEILRYLRGLEEKVKKGKEITREEVSKLRNLLDDYRKAKEVKAYAEEVKDMGIVLVKITGYENIGDKLKNLEQSLKIKPTKKSKKEVIYSIPIGIYEKFSAYIPVPVEGIEKKIEEGEKARETKGEIKIEKLKEPLGEKQYKITAPLDKLPEVKKEIPGLAWSVIKKKRMAETYLTQKQYEKLPEKYK